MTVPLASVNTYPFVESRLIAILDKLELIKQSLDIANNRIDYLNSLFEQDTDNEGDEDNEETQPYDSDERSENNNNNLYRADEQGHCVPFNNKPFKKPRQW